MHHKITDLYLGPMRIKSVRENTPRGAMALSILVTGTQALISANATRLDCQRYLTKIPSQHRFRGRK